MYCMKCGDVHTAQVDGYCFGDRLLEGVYFLFDYKNKKVVNVRVEDSAKEYMEDLNKKKWLIEAKEFIQEMIDNDDWYSFTCPAHMKHNEGIWKDKADYDES